MLCVAGQACHFGFWFRGGMRNVFPFSWRRKEGVNPETSAEVGRNCDFSFSYCRNLKKKMEGRHVEVYCILQCPADNRGMVLRLHHRCQNAIHSPGEMVHVAWMVLTQPQKAENQQGRSRKPAGSSRKMFIQLFCRPLEFF